MARLTPARRVVLALAAAFLFGPVVLYFAGVTDRALENRPLSARPHLSQGWKMFDQATRYLVDRLPLRRSAVRANTWISVNVFDQTPRYGGVGVGGERSATALPFGAPQQNRKAGVPATGRQATAGQAVLLGRDGWLYLADDTRNACHPQTPYPAAVARWAHLVRAIRATGRRAVVIFMPDKTEIYPEHLPTARPDGACAARGQATLWGLLEQAPPPGLVGLRRAELALKARERGRLIYRQRDSHPNTVGALPLLRAALDAIDLKLAAGDVRPAPPERFTPDLTVLLGTPSVEVAPAVGVQRTGIGPIAGSQTRLPSGQQAPTYAQGPGAARVREGRTVLVGDSFSGAVVAPLAQFTRHLTYARWGLTVGDDLRAAIAGADTVIMEVVQRNAALVLTDAQIDALAAGLGAPPG